MLGKVVFVICVLSWVECDEPRSCSQINYLEQLLERVIKMEINVESLHEKIVKTNSETISALDELKQEKDNFQNEIAVFENQMKDEMKTMRELLLSPNILFKTRKVRNQSPSTGETIVFTDIMMNYGDGYDKNTGVFTSPVNGTYIFTIHMCLRNDKMFRYNIVLDNTIYTSGMFYGDKSQYTCPTADALLYLQAGNQVWLECSFSGTGSEYRNVLLDHSSSTFKFWNTFSGMLVHV